MIVERKVEENGTITENIKLTVEEGKALDEAHLIVAERYRMFGIEQSTMMNERLEYALLGQLRFEGVEAMLNWAKTAMMRKHKGSIPRGYC